MRFAFFSFLLLTSVAVHAQDAECDEKTPEQLKPIMEVAAVADEETTCPNRNKLKNLCVMISSRMKDSSGKNKYLYQSRLIEASCIDPVKDSEDIKNEKIRKAWATYEADLKCNSTQFDVTDGHLLKYAVSYKFDDFITDAIKWKVNLNKVDVSDGRTVLDYIKFHIDRNKGNALEEMFQNYYDRLRKAGAKHKSEL